MNSYYWFFIDKDLTLKYGDGRPVEVGSTHAVRSARNGLYASKRAIDSLKHVRGPMACRVALGGDILHRSDNCSSATERTYLSLFDATEVLELFPRLCALDMTHLWNAPSVVKRFLETGSDDLREESYIAIGNTFDSFSDLEVESLDKNVDDAIYLAYLLSSDNGGNPYVSIPVIYNHLLEKMLISKEKGVFDTENWFK